MTDYKVLVEEARQWQESPNNQHGRGTTTDLADAVEALVAENKNYRHEREQLLSEAHAYEAWRAEREAFVKELGEARARFGDSEARRVELEAVIHKLDLWADEERYKISGDHSTWTEWHQGIESAQEEVLHIIDPARRSTVLGEHDQEVSARALEDAAARVSRMYAGTDGTDRERAWIGGVDSVARALRERAAAIRKGKP